MKAEIARQGGIKIIAREGRIGAQPYGDLTYPEMIYAMEVVKAKLMQIVLPRENVAMNNFKPRSVS